MYSYQLNIGSNSVNLGPQLAGPQARIDYDPTSGILNLSFQYQENGDGEFAYNDSPNLTYQLGATTFAAINTDSFLIDNSINPLHPLADQNSPLQTLLYPQ